MKIVASQRTKLIRERTKYVNDYNAKKAKYDEQVNKFETDKRNYASNMEDFLKAFLSAELQNLPGAQVRVEMSKDHHKDDPEYYVRLFNNPKVTNEDGEKRYRESDYYHDVNSGYYNGFKWTFAIYIKTEYDGYDENGNRKYKKTLQKAPQINANVIDANDYDTLKYTYELFAKIETIDWESIINKINSSVPQRDNYVTEPNPGYMDTSDYDKQITHYTIARVMGKDIWVKVQINREESYDSYNSSNPGVDGWGWIRVLSATDKFYTFNWLKGDRTSFESDTVQRALRRQIRMKKIYIKPHEPVEYMSTEDITMTKVPALNDIE